MKFAIFLTTLISLNYVFSTGIISSKFPPYCYESSCYCVNQKQSISSLWELPKRTTPLISKFRCAINNLIYEVDETQLAILYAQTLWTVDVLTDFDASISPSCVYSDMISKSLEHMKSDCTSKLREALIDYGRLYNYATNYSIAVGLSAAGCPVKLEDYKTCSKKICPIEKSFYDFISLNPVKFPNEIKALIISLSKSPNVDDRVTALAAVASATDISVQFFIQQLKRKELLKTVQLKSCSSDIPLVCCPLRKEEITRRCENLGRLSDKIIKIMLRKWHH